MPRELMYPCFLTCLEYTEDDYWKNIFEDLSFGIAPQGTYITKNYLISNVKTKEFVYKINTENDGETLFWDIYTALSDKMGLKSLNEIEDFKNSIDASEIIFNSWNSIKKKSIRDSIIMNYVSGKAVEYDLSPSTAKKLLNTINLGLMLKLINTKNIHYDNGVIHEIHGFDFCTGDFVFNKTNDYTVNVIECIKIKLTLVDIWARMIDIFVKSIYTPPAKIKV